MSEKKTDIIEPQLQKDTTAYSLKNRIRDKIPDGIDLSSIGAIDLSEAEKIAAEEIVFLTEEDLIEGLEDFELIPVKAQESAPVEQEIRKNYLSPGLRIKTISAADTEEKAVLESGNDGEEKNISSETDDETVFPEVKEEIIEEPEIERNISAETISGDEKNKDFQSDFVEAAPRISGSSETGVNSGVMTVSALKEPGRITEDSVNIQLEDIFAGVDAPEDTLPQRFKISHKSDKVRFIDDPQLSAVKAESEIFFQGDPLTERLSRVIHAAEAAMSVITEKSDYYNEHSYLIEDMTFFDKKDTGSAESDEIFYSDPDLDFFENAIIKNDFSRFIQQIDDYYDMAKIESESRISEILGLNSEERELIDKDLFSGYYSKIDIESEIDFLNPDLDFINRVFVQNKDVSYIIDDPHSLIDDEKISIEDDITAGSAIVFEEDVEDLRLLMKRDYGQSSDIEKTVQLPERESAEKQSRLIEENIPAVTESAVHQEFSEIINITDKVIIIDDKADINAFTKKFPGKEEDLVRLFSYLDGLFEKLPEETIRKFAESEYFDLYVKVMNEIGA